MAGLFNFAISVRADTKRLVKDLGALADKQIPFATAQALNSMGTQIRDAERANIKAVFPTATPFTVNSVVVLRARKGNPTVTILMKDTSARYMQPFEIGGVHVLNSKALLNPKNISLNQYGNLPKNKLQSLKGMPGVFIGTVRTKHGPVSGVWQRPYNPAPLAKGQKKARIPRGANTTGRMVLLIRFGDALPVKERLNYIPLARTMVAMLYPSEFTKAMNAAMASARP